MCKFSWYSFDQLIYLDWLIHIILDAFRVCPLFSIKMAYNSSIKQNEMQNILFYRDGVSDFMFKTVLEQELPQIIRGASAAQPGYKPLISLIVVVKRHNTRFFLPQALRWTEKEIGVMDIKSSNIEAGTVVDLEVCDAQKFDFYILSHVPNGQGTPRPSHYYVLYDEANFT